MQYEELKNIFMNNKNIKKWKVDERDDETIFMFNDCIIKINNTMAKNIDTVLEYKVRDIDIQATIEDIEKDINTILSRDWEEQVYSRYFRAFIPTHDPLAKPRQWLKNISRLGFIDQTACEDVGDNGNSYQFILNITTFCSLDKETIDKLNGYNLNDIVKFDTDFKDADVYSDWYGKGFYKVK